MGATTAFDEDQPTMLPARMDLGSFEQIAQILRNKRGPDIRVDAQNVTHLGAIGVQLLLAAANSAASKGGQLVLSNPSPAFSQALIDFGLPQDVIGGVA